MTEDSSPRPADSAAGVPEAAGAPAAHAPEPAAAEPRRRRHRRAVGGTAGADGPEPRAARDHADTDHGWGGAPEDDGDERILREKPPHW